MFPLTELLKQNPVFSCMDAATRERLANCAIRREFNKGGTITFRGDVWPNLFIISKGIVNALKESSEGRSLVVASFVTGDLFWGLAFFHEEMSMPVTLVAQTPASIFLWPRENILSLLVQNGQSFWELCRLMISRMQYASEMLEEMAFQPLTGRVARLLLEQFPTDQQSATRHLTLDEMAARVGTTREMVCRILYRFAEEGAIQINRTEFIFKDRKLLEERIQGVVK